jgi:flagellar biosynthesis protein FlhA
MAASCIGIGVSLLRARKRESKARAAKPGGEAKKAGPQAVKEQTLAMDALEVEVGYGLIAIVDGQGGGNLPDRIGSIREKVAAEYGFVVPAVRIRDNMQLRPHEYIVKLRGVTIARWQIEPGHYLAMAARDDIPPVEGTATKEPAFGLRAIWIAEREVARAEAAGYTVVDPTSVMATHLSELIRRHAAELLTREEVASLIEHLKQKAPAVVAEVLPDLLKLGQIQKVLQNLLREHVSIRDLETIMETLADWAPRTKDPEVLGEYARHGLSRAIGERYVAADGKLHAVTLDPNVEEYLDNAIERTDRGSFLALPPEVSGKIVAEVSEKLKALVIQGHPPVVLCAPQVRFQLRRLIAAHLSDVVVLALSEIMPDVEVEVVGNVRVGVP